MDDVKKQEWKHPLPGWDPVEFEVVTPVHIPARPWWRLNAMDILFLIAWAVGMWFWITH